jgi:hypothetical protein
MGRLKWLVADALLNVGASPVAVAVGIARSQVIYFWHGSMPENARTSA